MSCFTEMSAKMSVKMSAKMFAKMFAETFGIAFVGSLEGAMVSTTMSCRTWAPCTLVVALAHPIDTWGAPGPPLTACLLD